MESDVFGIEAYETTWPHHSSTISACHGHHGILRCLPTWEPRDAPLPYSSVLAFPENEMIAPSPLFLPLATKSFSENASLLVLDI